MTAFFLSAVAPSLHLTAFIPFLALAAMRYSLQRCLWISLACGLIIDLLSSQMHFGLYALSYSLITLLLYRFNRYFFEEKLHALALFALLFSFLSSAIELLFLFASHKSSLFSPRILVTDLFLMPLLDAVYAFLWFTCPMHLISYLKKTSWRQLFSKTEEE